MEDYQYILILFCTCIGLPMLSLLIDFSDVFIIVFNPKYWMMLDPYSKEWDIEFNKLLDKEDFVLNKPNSINNECYTAKLGEYEIWITNYPYSTFHPYNYSYSNKANFRPSRLTIIRAKRRLDKVLELNKDPFIIWKQKDIN